MSPRFVFKRLLPLLVVALVGHGHVFAQESFRVELGKDGETLRDMRPVFLKFESRPLPAISPAEVARRYQKLFEDSDEPEVRIDALNRLNNIRDRSGENIGFSEEKEAEIYEDVLGSYENILSRGSFSGRLDELLYQMAKAHALTGQHQESIQRLRQLVGLYPTSELVPEARFRIAEAEFSAGRYLEAENGYRALITAGARSELATKARYMQGWSQFKQGEQSWGRAAGTFMELLDQQLPSSEQIQQPHHSSLDMVEDSFRVLALMASRLDDAQTLERWLASRSQSPWFYLLYDRLADLHAVEGRYAQAVAVNNGFVRAYTEHESKPDFLIQNVEFWEMAGQPRQVRQAKETFVAEYLAANDFQQLPVQHQQRWQLYGRTLADFYYASGSRYQSDGQGVEAKRSWAKAAEYYEMLGGRSVADGELMHLAGDARLLAEHRTQALTNFRLAAYDAGYDRANEAGWAAITLLRSVLTEGGQSPGATDQSEALATLSAEEQRYSQAFGVDERVSALRADLANRWYARGDYQRALAYAKKTLDWDSPNSEQRYAAWLVIARVQQHKSEFGLAERAWRQALTLAETENQLAVPAQEQNDIREQLAVAIYKQGEQAAAAGNAALAVAHFQRVVHVVPGSELAIKSRFDAANTLLKAAEWLAAINELNRFRGDYAEHPLAEQVSEKLVYSYQQSGQPLKAANELLATASRLPDPWPQRLRAAAIYHESNQTERRNELYREWLSVAPRPATAGEHVQQQTMRQRLIKSGATDSGTLQALVAIESESQWHSDETLSWAADAALTLGVRAAEEFAAIGLVHPLEETLVSKQAALERAQNYLLEAETFAGEAVVTEVLFRRAELYRVLAADLMASEVPAELNELETMQYQMLLEEEAYPVEERAMELHTQNHQKIRTHGYDEWVGQSLEALAAMHPGRYSRNLRWMTWAEKENDGV
ncbi:Outer membrane protein assembly factor BamD [Marinobacter litoralis]|uniref:Outer membrane protein assembly factor BamD n=1 Tax=Marinobacter litoralis TaxID=187981 RepID=A0A3M2RLL2_9GAMM|nr:tetratricopeptide repeat protein [Marinobacter litoralis]RMJ06168.1 Outer membrane protein assembly factor BamD [Marinobacter litoralis]